jgi:hypothetical protein
MYTLLQKPINMAPCQFFSKHALNIWQDGQVGLATIVTGENFAQYIISIQ